MKQEYTLFIKFNCNRKNNGCMTRNVTAKKYLVMPYDKWRKKVDYRRSWKSECIFFDFKWIINKRIDHYRQRDLP